MNLSLSRIEIKNFLSYKNVIFKDLKSYNILIGKNSSGKSNFFKNLQMLQQCYTGSQIQKKFYYDEIETENCEIDLIFSLGIEFRSKFFKFLYENKLFDNAILFENTVQSLQELKKSSTIYEWRNIETAVKWLVDGGYCKEINIKMVYLPQLHLLTFQSFSFLHERIKEPQILAKITFNSNQTNVSINDILTITIERFYINNFFSQNKLINFNSQGGYYAPYVIVDLLLTHKYFFEIFKEIKNFFTGILHFIPDKRTFLPFDDITKAIRQNLSPDGSNFVTFLYKKYNKNENQWLKAFNQELSNFIPEIDELRQEVSDENQTILQSKEGGLNMVLPLKNMGAGVMNVAHFIAYIMELGEGKILCIEEPELHLHPGLILKLRDKFLEVSKNNQIFIATHAREFLYEDEEESSVYLIRKENNQSSVNKIFEENFDEIYEELDIDINKYKLQQNFLYNEEALKLFIKKAMEPKRIEDDLWDFKLTLDFWDKLSKSDKKEEKIKFCNQITSFANTNGGILIVGITDKDPKQVVGIEDLENKVKQIKKVIREFTNTTKDFIKCKEILISNKSNQLKNCLLIAIKQTKDPIAVRQLDGSYIVKKRNNTEAETVKYEEILKLKEDVKNDNFDFFINLKKFIG